MIEQFVDLPALWAKPGLGDLAADPDQLAHHRLFTHDRGIGLDVGRARRLVRQHPQVRKTADLVERFQASEFLGQGYDVERPVGLRQAGDCGIHQLVFEAIEVLFADLIGNPVPCAVVQHETTEYGLLGLQRMRWYAQRFHLRVACVIGRCLGKRIVNRVNHAAARKSGGKP